MAKTRRPKIQSIGPETGAKPEPEPDSPPPADVLKQPIDDRMAALLADHQRMGARPK